MLNSNLFFALRASGRTLAEDAKEAGTVTLLGMVAIFAVLALLWLVIEILHRALSEKKEMPEKETAPVLKQSVPTPVETVLAESDGASDSATEDDGALIAVITAAVSAAMADEGYTGGFRVVSFKRTSARRNCRG